MNHFDFFFENLLIGVYTLIKKCSLGIHSKNMKFIFLVHQDPIAALISTKHTRNETIINNDPTKVLIIAIYHYIFMIIHKPILAKPSK